MLYKRYQDARDAAWRTLLRFEISRLPVDVEQIAKGLGITPEPWPDAAQTPKLYALLPKHAAAASLRISGVWHIFMRQHMEIITEIRFLPQFRVVYLSLSVNQAYVKLPVTVR